MKNQKINAFLKTTALKAGSMVLAAALLIGGSTLYGNYRNTVPELVTFVDSEGTVSIDEDEVPLGNAKVTTTTKTSKKTKKIKLKTASKKTYSKKGKTTTKTTTKKSKSSTAETTTKTVVKTSVTNKYKKGSKINTQVTTTKTTTTKTVVPINNTAAAKTVAASAGSASTISTVSTVAITQIAPKADSRALNAYQKLGFTVTINPSVSYAGLCDARTRSITLKKADDTVYHELGHFVAFVAGNVDLSAEFQAIFNQEKSAYTDYNKSYVLKNSSEYFAESFKNYTLNPSALKASRPQTYAAMESALSKITDAQLTKLQTIYGAIWK